MYLEEYFYLKHEYEMTCQRLVYYQNVDQQKFQEELDYYGNIINLLNENIAKINNLEFIQKFISLPISKEIDFHGCSKDAAIYIIKSLLEEKNLQILLERGIESFKIITGWGLHSPGKQSFIKEFVGKEIQKRNLKYYTKSKFKI
ncbi:hypothetical protein RF11_13298 [Thelohanellus kitauei]|uniref:Smr domain-containing protein n=1 Tax=Thelohanellus kitauei TaxID=669202 RepID=A0A0C2NGP5_THEKT|nr:hypothetical protein RF11_13298 [Thelohanellus kitauei]